MSLWHLSGRSRILGNVDGKKNSLSIPPLTEAIFMTIFYRMGVVKFCPPPSPLDQLLHQKLYNLTLSCEFWGVGGVWPRNPLFCPISPDSRTMHGLLNYNGRLGFLGKKSNPTNQQSISATSDRAISQKSPPPTPTPKTPNSQRPSPSACRLWTSSGSFVLNEILGHVSVVEGRQTTLTRSALVWSQNLLDKGRGYH